MPIRSTFDLTHSNRELVELTPMLMKARNKRSLNLPLFKVDHTRLALDFREVESWQLPKNLVNQRVVLLVRDPRDVMVSNWFEKKYRKGTISKDKGNCGWVRGIKTYMAKYKFNENPVCNANGTCSCFDDAYTIDEFMREPEGGFQTICHFMTFYRKNAAQYKKFIVIRYEDLKNNTAFELQRVLDFANEYDGRVHTDTQVPYSSILQAVELSDFERMRTAELHGGSGARLAPRDPNNPNTFKTREGVVGSFRKHFDESTQVWMLETMRKHLDESYRYNETK